MSIIAGVLFLGVVVWWIAIPKRKAGDRCMGKTAVNLSVLNLNDLTLCAENDFVELFEAFELARAKRGK